MKREEYLFNDKYCEQAISDFKHSASIRRWLNQYDELFNIVKILPDGLPRITSFNLGEEKFENIKLFSCLYSAVFDVFGVKDKNKKYDDTIVFKIDRVALFEDRRFFNASQKTYLFIDKECLKSQVDVKNYVSKLQPITVDESIKNRFIHAPEIKFLISNEEYNNVLIQVLELSTNFEEVNILFPYLVNNNDFDENSISKIVNFSLNSLLVKRSFNAQRMMFELAFKNKMKIDSSLLHSVMSDFPHAHGLFKLTNRDKVKR
jgi:hypothetical protein